MTSPATNARGSYPKGRAKREEILAAALDQFAQQGYRATSLRGIARTVGLTQTGVMHHFDSKEQLLTEVLARRDDIDEQTLRSEGFDVLAALIRLANINAARPGLVRLFTVLSAESTDSEHPAHEFFANRYRRIADELRNELADPEVYLPVGIDPHMAARLLMAIMDGLQVQWLFCDDFDVAAAFTAFVELLRPATDSV